MMPIVKKIIKNKEGERPVMVYFQNGKIKPDEGNNLEPNLYTNKQGKTIVGITNGEMLYAGTIDNDDLYDNYLLINNKRTGKIRLVQADTCIVSPLLNKRHSLMDVTVATTSGSLSELNKQFGSKKTKRITEQRERLMMNIETVKEQLEKTVSDVKVDEVDTAPTENDSLYRPKINRDASTIEQVYRMEDIVPRNVLDSLSREAQEIVIDKDNDLTSYGFNSFVSKSISKVLSDSPDRLKIHRATVFLYINYLIKFMTTPMKNISKKFVACDISQEVNKHILDNFSCVSGSHRTRPLSLKDKALCSILVLSAICMDYSVDIEALSKDFKVGIKKIMDTSRVLAFSSSGKNKSVITLKLPLPEPVSLTLKRKKK